MSNINILKLKKDLMDYFGTAVFNGMPNAMIELSKISNASDSQIINLALNIGFDLSEYEEGKNRTR